MKTDYEFIKDKFGESGVNAPDSLNEDFILEKISDAEPEKDVRKDRIKGLSLAAAVALLTVTAFGAANLIKTPAPVKPAEPFSAKASLRYFNSRGEVEEELKNILDKRENYNSLLTYERGYSSEKLAVNEYLSDSATAYGGAKGASSSHNTTYVQETGVDEADTVKTDGRYIYYLNDNVINIFSADGKNSEKLAEIKEPDKSDNFYFNDFYLYGDSLVAIDGCWTYLDNGAESFAGVKVFDISDIKNIKCTDSFTQSGSCCSSRMIGSTVYLVSNYSVYNKKYLPCAGFVKNGTTAAPDELSYTDICAVENPGDSNFLVVSCIDTEKGEQNTKTKAILGSAEEIYCNTEHLFVTAREYEFEIPERASTDDEAVVDYIGYYYAPKTVATQIVKVDLTNGLEFTATAKVEGYIDNQYSMDEKDGHLRIATTTSDENFVELNSLVILDENLSQTGLVTGFAKDESIKAVRYIGDTAYVITYEETDPLFVIDVKDVTSPKILGEVKISGFSTMLVPVDENTLLGIGYHTEDEDYTDLEVQEGIKLALFDVSDKTDPKVLDEKVFKNYDSEVQYNPKALVVNYERNDYVIPYSHWEYGEDDYSSEFGAINFKVEGKKIKVIDKYVSDKFTDNDDEYSSLDRCVYVGNYIYMLGTHENYYDSDYSIDPVIDAVEYK